MSDQTLERLKLALHDRYAIERRIGQGGMATVYLAEDLKHRRQVAIKVLRPELSASLGAERFLREIELAAKLQHPHIVPVYDSGSADDVLYYVMPFVDGESLRDLMAREGRLTLERAAEIIREASSGLSYAHSHGVVHRDVKPENIMLSDGHAVVTDFGIARAIETARAADSHLTGAGMAIGTPAYMSPEQATADKVDARSDQYALACVFYELVTGKQAFSGPTMQAMLTSMLTGPRPRMATIVDDVPPPVDAATQRALSSDPTQRFNSINEFARAVSAETSGAAAATRESRRWKRLAIALPVIVALLGAAWVAFMGQPGRSVVSGAETIAVVPFTVSGSGLEGIGEGMVDLLAANLDGVGEIRAIEPRTVMREWRRRVSEGAGSLEDALAVGRSTRAASVLTGSIVASGGTARLTAELYDLDGNRLALTTVSGPTDSVLTLADALTLSLLREVWRSREPLPSANAFAINSASMPAIRAYLTGERYHRRGEWDSAQVAFEEAVQADSTFALAWHRLANTLGWKGLYQGPEARDAAARAVQYSDSLPPRMRSLLYATNLFQLGDYATADSAESYLRRYPDDADGWYLLGEARFHGRELRPYSPAELREPFDKVLALDSSLTPAAIHPMELAIQMNDPALMRRYEAVFEAAGATAALREAELASLALRGSDSAMAELLSSSATGSGAALSALSGFIQSGASGDSLVSTMSRLVTRLQDESPQFAAFPAVMAASLGRIDTALVLMGPAANSDNGFYIRMFPVLAGFADSTVALELDERLGSAPANHFLLIWRSLARLHMGNAAGARALLGPTLAAPPDSLPRFLLGSMTMIEGLARVAQGDTVAGMAVADSGLKLIGTVRNNAFTIPVQLLYAQALVSRPSTRAEGIERLRWGFPYNTELEAVRQYYLGRALELDGKPEEAADSYSRFLRLWDRPDSLNMRLVEDARSALERVTSEAAPGTAPATP